LTVTPSPASTTSSAPFVGTLGSPLLTSCGDSGTSDLTLPTAIDLPSPPPTATSNGWFSPLVLPTHPPSFNGTWTFFSPDSSGGLHLSTWTTLSSTLAPSTTTSPTSPSSSNVSTTTTLPSSLQSARFAPPPYHISDTLLPRLEPAPTPRRSRHFSKPHPPPPAKTLPPSSAS
ncbi:hypothetical protein M427DRAFT_507349, partial [Gonapodya prolifera JEL478]